MVTLAAAPSEGQIALHNRLLAVPGLGPVLVHTVSVPFKRSAARPGLDAALAPERPTPTDCVDACAAYESRPGQLLPRQVLPH